MTMDLQRVKERLERKRAELQELIQDMTGESLPMIPVTNRDEATQNDEVANSLLDKLVGNSVVSNEARLLQEVQEALGRIAEGRYGVCTMCGEPIPEPRLEALPWAALCLKDQQRFERATVQMR